MQANNLRRPFSGPLIHQIERLFQHGTVVGLTESELLERFVSGHDESAFEALIARHGPMVLGVCRQLLRDPNDVDDAFQATFLVLVRKAGTLRRCDLLGNWLYGVAYRVATRARVMAARRLAKAPYGQEVVERLGGEGGRRPAGLEEASSLDREPRPWLHEEVRRLPEKYRVPVLLCYFEGLTHEEAARRLGWPLGTVKGRLARARDLLRRRLTRHGLTLSPAALADRLAVPDLRAVVPAALEYATLQAARTVAWKGSTSIATAAAVSLPVAALTEGALQAMILTKLKAIAFSLLVIGAVATGVVIGATQVIPDQQELNTAGPVATETTEKIAAPAAQPVSAKTKTAKAKDPTSSRPAQKAQSPARESTAGVEGGPPGGMGVGRGGMGGMMGPMGMMGQGGMMGQMMPQMRGGMGGGDTAETIEFKNRLEIAQLGAALATKEKNPRNQVVLRALDEPISMSFANETPLDDVLKYIKAATTKSNRAPIPIYVDPLGLQHAERSINSTVTINLEGIPLKTSLRLILKQLGLAYCVRDGVLIISSVQGICEELAEQASELRVTDPGAAGSMIDEKIEQIINQMQWRSRFKSVQ
jgi:RNA polymerase sigma factor (sigma-70 family)